MYGIFFGLLFTTTSFSLSTIDFLKHKNVSTLIAKRSKKFQKGNFSDLSGEWKGACVTETDESPQFTLTIQQNDYSITFNEDGVSLTYAINGVETSSYTINAYHFTREDALHWNKEGNILIFNSFLSDLGNYSGPTPIVTIMDRSTWQLLNNQLIVSIDEHNFEGEETYTKHAVCTFSKLVK